MRPANLLVRRFINNFTIQFKKETGVEVTMLGIDINLYSLLKPKYSILASPLPPTTMNRRIEAHSE